MYVRSFFFQNRLKGHFCAILRHMAEIVLITGMAKFGPEMALESQNDALRERQVAEQPAWL